jgi:NAD(P)H-dependent flavin oxidoreductase YrpB (nitropropane dioxygenase family)
MRKTTGAPMNGDPLNTRLCEEYGCEVPIVAFAHTKDVIAAVTNAGGIGILGGTGMTPDELKSDIEWIRDKVGDRPFGVDLLVPASFVEGNQEDLEQMITPEHRDFVESLHKDNDIPKPKPIEARDGNISSPNLLQGAREALDTLLELRIPIFASGLGSPAFILEEAHAVGTKVWGLVGLPRQARRQVEAGVDVIVAQGYDSGGHSGTVGTFTLVPEVVEMAEGSDTLVVAAGGVSNGKHLAAALAMGAAGVWTGTIWLATHESETAMFLKQRIVDAQAEDAVQSRATSGKPIRQLRSNWSDAWKQSDAPEPLQMPLQGMLVGEIQRGIREAKMEDWMTTPAGQSVVGIHSIKPAAQVVFDMAEQAQDHFDQLVGEPVTS